MPERKKTRVRKRNLGDQTSLLQKPINERHKLMKKETRVPLETKTKNSGQFLGGISGVLKRIISKPTSKKTKVRLRSLSARSRRR